MKKLLTAVIIILGLASKVNAQLSVSAYGALSIPNGSFSDYYNSAFGVRGNVLYSTGGSFQFILHSGYNVWKFNNEKFNDWFHKESGVGNFNLEIPITAVPLLLGTRYSRDYSGNTKLFLEVAGGVYFITTEASGKFTDNTGTYDLGNDKKNYTEFTVHLGAGLSIALSNRVSLEPGVYFDFITNSEAAKQAKPKNSKEYYEGNQVRTLILCLGFNYRL